MEASSRCGGSVGRFRLFNRLCPTTFRRAGSRRPAFRASASVEPRRPSRVCSTSALPRSRPASSSRPIRPITGRTSRRRCATWRSCAPSGSLRVKRWSRIPTKRRARRSIGWRSEPTTWPRGAPRSSGSPTLASRSMTVSATHKRHASRNLRACYGHITIACTLGTGMMALLIRARGPYDNEFLLNGVSHCLVPNSADAVVHRELAPPQPGFWWFVADRT